MELARLIYTSTASDDCSATQIQEILEVSVRLNTLSGISGILYYSNKYFMQYLEGRKADIEATYSRIDQDERHYSLRVLDLVDISRREFDNWSMAYVPRSEILTPLNLQFMKHNEFSPAEISASEAMDLTLKLRELLPQAHYNATSTDEPINLPDKKY